jgi:hypothetical protein
MATNTTSPRNQHASASRAGSAQPVGNGRGPSTRETIALQIRLAERGGESFYAWGVSWTCTHPASDPVGAAQIMSHVLQVGRSRADACECHQ